MLTSVHSTNGFCRKRGVLEPKKKMVKPTSSNPYSRNHLQMQFQHKFFLINEKNNTSNTFSNVQCI